MSRKKDVKISLENANLPGRKYMDDKPKDCRFCYWWEGNCRSCALKECYYLLPLEKEEKNEQEGQPGDCKSCPYGKHFPCIGYCTEKLLQEMKEQERS